MERKKQKALQWHPAFYADMQIEFEKERENLMFENEHQLGTKPKEIDVLIIKKEKKQPVRKNIGQIFREHNIVEYKSPTESLSIDDFYKVLGYAFFYKSDTAKVDEIKISEITISFAFHRYPKALMKHLAEHGYHFQEKFPGVIYVIGAAVPIQLLWLPRLSEKENFWLKNLTDSIDDEAQADQIAKRYGEKKDDKLYQSVMDIIVRANQEKFGEAKEMCDALRELFQDEFEEKERQVTERVTEQVTERVTERVNTLCQKLIDQNRLDDLKRSTQDMEYQKQLMKEFGIE